MRRIENAFNHVRGELHELGLLDEGKYLDRIDLVVSPLPRFLAGGAMGFVFDEGAHFLARLVGFAEGTIYIPAYMEQQSSKLRGVIRHEFAHAWAWLDGRFIRGSWFREAFGRPYFSRRPRQPEPENFRRSQSYATHATAYAMTHPCEDFAETLEIFVRDRDNLDRHQGRPGFHRKLKAVEHAVRQKARSLR
jgi:hypothetical protein